jgi:hypothetical protein
MRLSPDESINLVSKRDWTQLSDEKFVADRAASKVQRSAERLAARLKKTEEMTAEQVIAKITRIRARSCR